LRDKFGQNLANSGQELAKRTFALSRRCAVAIIGQFLTNNGQIVAENGQILTTKGPAGELARLWPNYGPYLGRNWTISGQLYV
jgi:hypothetical protein